MARISRYVAGVSAVGAALVGMTIGTTMKPGIAQAVPEPGYGWCPGQALPFDNIRWDMSVCHTWWIVPPGTGNVTMVDLNGNPLDSFIYTGDTPPVRKPPPAPSGPPPGTPFCSPRGALIIIPPICDEIGVDWPPGSLQN